MYGTGIDWAGVMVERLNPGYSLGSYMDEKMFKPFGMNSTTFHIDQREDIMSRLVPTAMRESDGTLSEKKDPVFRFATKEESGGGGLWSSVPDFMKILADLISPQPTLLKPTTVETFLAAPQIPRESKALKPLIASRGGAVSANAAAMDDAPPMNYGCGGMVTTRDSEVLPAGTLTWGGLPNLKWFLNREHGIAAMYATQIMPAGDAKSNELSSAFFKEVFRLHKERQ